MKKVLSLLLTGTLLIAGMDSFAQTTKFYNRNNDERIGSRVTTTDSTLTYVDSANILDNEAGFLEVSVIGYAKDTAYAVTGKIAARYNKRRGTLTLGSITEQVPITTDAALGTSTFTIVAADNRIYIRVKGKAATNITWTSIVKRKSMATTL